MQRHRLSRQGFTLVELSIVLVVIGLLISGVLIGQSLIESAKINSQVRQLQQFDIATQSFVSKFRKLPGDAPIPINIPGQPGTFIGNANGRLEHTPGTNNDCKYYWHPNKVGECSYFWAHLALLNFIPGGDEYKRISGNDPAYKNYTKNWVFDGDGSSSNKPYPRPAIFGSKVIIHWNKRSYIYSNWVQESGLWWSFGHLSGVQALSIDQKMDDGLGDGGNVLNASHNVPTAAGVLYPFTTVSQSYNLSVPEGDYNGYKLQVKSNAAQ